MVNSNLDKDYDLVGDSKKDLNDRNESFIKKKDILIATTQGTLPFTAKGFEHIEMELNVVAYRKVIEEEQNRLKELEEQRKKDLKVNQKDTSNMKNEEADIQILASLVKRNKELFDTLPLDVQKSVILYLAGVSEEKKTNNQKSKNNNTYRKMMLDDERFRTNFNNNSDGRIKGAFYSGQGDMRKRY